MTTFPTIVLLGGSGLAPWAWQRVGPLLDADGMRVLAPQLRATGDDTTPAAEVSLTTWIDDLAGFLAAEDLRDITLVAHSFAGYVATGVLAREADRIRDVVFLDAALPKPGRTWFDVMGEDVRSFMSGLAEDGAIPFFSRDQLNHLYPGHGISDTDWSWMQPQLTAQPIATYSQPAISEPIDQTAAQLTYIRCLRTAPPAAHIDAETAGWRARILDAGHWPMITHPNETAEVIKEATIR